MPSEVEHIQQSLHNMQVTDYLRAQSDFCDRTATVTFYTALHVVEAVFFHTSSGQGQHGVNHEMREAMLKKNNRYKKLYQHYRPLLSTSLVARYLC